MNAAQLAGSGGIVPSNLIQASSSWPAQESGYATALAISSAAVKTVVMPGVAATLNTVLSVSGRGALQFLALANADTTARILRMKVTLDGTVVFDKTTASTGAFANSVWPVVGSVVFLAGSNSAAVPVYNFESMLFNSSLLIEFQSNVTDAQSGRIAYRVIGR